LISKKHNKYVLFMTFVTCIALLSNKLTSRDGNKIEDKPSRIIIKSTEKEYIQENRYDVSDEGTRATTSTANGTSKFKVEPLPVPDANSPIVLSPLS
jgi:hypothetical protein